MATEILTQALFDNDESVLSEINQQLEKLDPVERIHWSLQHLPDTQVLSSSFGIQSAVMLHLLTSIKPDIPVVLIDTGYLFTETYQFIDNMTQRLDLNLQIYRSELSPAWQEARYGELWAQGLEGINQYNQINKVEPMQRALAQLNVGSWYAGLRRQQANSRAELPVLKIQNGRFKMHPIIDWTNRDVHHYLTQHNMPYHPLWERGYVSVGDYHSSRPLELGMSEEETRFSGLKRECGLHE